MVRLARNTGGASTLFAPGVSNVNEMSQDFFSAMHHANTILSWQENLTKDEVPPPWMWPFPEHLEEWFTEVEFMREQRYGGGESYDDLEQNAWDFDD